MVKVKNTIGGLPTPIFYPSVSGVSKNNWSVIDHVELLVACDYPQFLVSCFDVYKNQNNSRLQLALEKAKEQSQVVLWDSGLYEMVWSRSKRWCKKRYIKTLKRNDVSYAFSFDDFCLNQKTQNSSIITSSIQKTIKQASTSDISPIIHCKNPLEYPALCMAVSQSCKPKLIAIPERELGRGVLEILLNIKKIRTSLNTLDKYQTLHILGTGNPISMMLYAFAGADSFDGLDWCQTVVDFEKGTLHHPLQLDLYKHQSKWGQNTDINFFTSCYMHNLEFYKNWMPYLQQTIETDQIEVMLQHYLPPQFFDTVASALTSDIKIDEALYEIMAN
ncbi:MAG: hypothetical protein HRU23_12135 [Gammaproteobacteria bacterium]|nr:hypothetical protein [Gammaproteobacteria bacterium]